MARRKKRTRKTSKKTKGVATTSRMPRHGQAKAHSQLANDFIHVFVDDQNLFWGIVNREFGIGYRIDFGRLLLELARDPQGNLRPVKTAFIAGIVPDDDSFWEIARNQGFTVKRGYLGTNNRSKQDDAYLITELTATLYEQEGPSTVVLTAGGIPGTQYRFLPHRHSRL